jgi:hypothetical protein
VRNGGLYGSVALTPLRFVYTLTRSLSKVFDKIRTPDLRSFSSYPSAGVDPTRG